MKISRIVTALAAGTALSFTSLNAAQAEQLKVVSSFTIIGDMVQNVGGAHVQVINLAGHNVDLHHFEPKPSDVKKLTESEGVKLLFINGLELEPWVERIRASSGFKGKTVVLTEGVKAIKFEDIHDHDGEHEHDHDHDDDAHEHEQGEMHDDHDHDEHEGHAHGEWDPHAWQDPLNALIYVDNILKALKDTDPANADAYEANAADYISQIKKLNEEAKTDFAKLSEEQRRFATNHEAFAYMARAYDLTQIPVTGLGGAEPSPAQIAQVIEQLKSQNIRVVFLENTKNNRLIEQLARDAKIKVGGTLVADALQEKGPGSTYLGMLKKNTDTLLEALK